MKSFPSTEETRRYFQKCTSSLSLCTEPQLKFHLRSTNLFFFSSSRIRDFTRLALSSYTYHLKSITDVLLRQLILFVKRQWNRNQGCLFSPEGRWLWGWCCTLPSPLLHWGDAAFPSSSHMLSHCSSSSGKFLFLWKVNCMLNLDDRVRKYLKTN